MQQFLKLPPGKARARVVTPQLFDQFLIAMDDPVTTLDMGFGWETLAALAHGVKTRILRSIHSGS